MTATLVGPSLTQADDIDIGQIIESRQANFHDLGAAYKNLRDLLGSHDPPLVELRGYIQSVDDIAHYQYEQDWFPRGSGPEAGIKTRAKPAIWTNPDEFQKWRKALMVEADKLQALAVKGSAIAAIKAQHSELGETCTGCHKEFREREE
jgi:cytochrome c556